MYKPLSYLLLSGMLCFVYACGDSKKANVNAGAGYGMTPLYDKAGNSMAVEKPTFTIEEKTSYYEIRNYDSMLVAETQVNSNFEDAGEMGFSHLSAYILGVNKHQAAMTILVKQAVPKNESLFLVQFNMPKNFTQENPEPNDPQVKIRQLPPRRLAIYKYSGFSSQASRYQEKLAKFVDKLKENGFQTTGKPIFVQFNNHPHRSSSWWCNEIWLEVVNL